MALYKYFIIIIIIIIIIITYRKLSCSLVVPVANVVLIHDWRLQQHQQLIGGKMLHDLQYVKGW